MIEYIDRQELIDAGRAIKLKDICPDWNVPIVAKALKQQGQAFLELIKKAPTEDVVEVVRCKDCEMARETEDERYLFCMQFADTVGFRAFCSYGVKKEGAKNETE